MTRRTVAFIIRMVSPFVTRGPFLARILFLFPAASEHLPTIDPDPRSHCPTMDGWTNFNGFVLPAINHSPGSHHLRSFLLLLPQQLPPMGAMGPMGPLTHTHTYENGTIHPSVRTSGRSDGRSVGRLGMSHSKQINQKCSSNFSDV